MKNQKDHKAIFMPYFADLLPFMVIFEWMLWRQSGPPAYHHQHVLKTSWRRYRDKQNAYWAYLYLTNLTNLRRIQNALKHTTQTYRLYSHIYILKMYLHEKSCPHLLIYWWRTQVLICYIFLCNKRKIAVKPTNHQNPAVSKAFLGRFYNQWL